MSESAEKFGFVVVNAAKLASVSFDFTSLATTLNLDHFINELGNDLCIKAIILLNLVDQSYVIIRSPSSSSHTEDYNAIFEQNQTVSKLLFEFKVSSLPCIIEVLASGYSVPAMNLLGSINPSSLSLEDIMRAGVDAYENMDLISAMVAFEQIISVDPRHQAALFNLSCAYHFAGYPTLSLPSLQSLLLLKPDDRTAHSFLWALSNSVPMSSLVSVYEVLASSHDTQAATRLAVLTGKGSLAYKSDDSYVASVFDNLASVFEEKLTVHLQYDAPWILCRMITDLTSSIDTQSIKSAWRILDLGCGSGLCGKVFQPFFVPSGHTQAKDTLTIADACRRDGSVLIGVDISSKMIEICHTLSLYHSLHCLDLISTLQQCLSVPSEQRIPFDMVIAADTFVYVGALGEVFHLTAQVLKADGLFAFSTEDLESSPMLLALNTDIGSEEVSKSVSEISEFEIEGAVPGWGARLLSSARFGHSNSYITALCQRYGFEVIGHEVKTLRTEETKPLPGNMFVLRKLPII